MVAAIAGFCTSPWQLVALRGLVGFVHFSGFMTSIALGEVVDAESRNEGNHKHSHVPEANVKAFSWLAAGNAIGSMVGSTIGGYLSEPYGVPVLSGLKLFKIKPYAAPGLFLMFMTILASLAVLLVVKEAGCLAQR
jgi:MFS family permease